MENNNEQLILEHLISISRDIGEIKNIAKDLGERIDLHDLQMKEFNQWRIMAGPQLEKIISIEKWQETAAPVIDRLCKTNNFVDKNKDRILTAAITGSAALFFSNLGPIIDFIHRILPKSGG